MHAIAEPTRTTAETSIRPFRFHALEADLADLRRRIEATRWPDRETVEDSTQGTQLAILQKLARHWATQYDWRKTEARLNAVPNAITTIDGLDFHFLHVRSKHEDAVPLLLVHGWPGSIIERLKVIGPLTQPTAHGGGASEAFHQVVPTLPGVGFSVKPTATGWNPVRVAGAYVALMDRLGYDRYGVSGTDWGAIIVEQMALQAPSRILGLHTNMGGVVPPALDAALARGDPLPAGLREDEQRACEQIAFAYKHIAYALMMGDRPQSMTGLADSPVGLAAFMIDLYPRSYEMIARAIDGVPEGLTPDDVLDAITLFWLTNSAISAARFYWENRTPYFAVKGIDVPVAVSTFPDELFVVPKSWAEQAYPKLVHFNALPKGGHFPSWEQPALFTSEVRAAFRTLR